MMKARVIPSQPEIAVLYHFKETQQEEAVLRELLSQHHIEACSLPEEALGQTVASFLAGEPPVAGKQAPYPGQVIVFSGVAAQKQQAVLRALRDARVGREAIKAVVTPTNRGWVLERLFAELSAEHAHMTAPKTAEKEANCETN